MKAPKKSDTQQKNTELKNQLMNKFSQVLKGLGFGTHLFEKKLKKSTKKLAKSITKKKSKEGSSNPVSPKPALIKPAKLKQASAAKLVKPNSSKKPSESPAQAGQNKTNAKTNGVRTRTKKI